MKNIIKSLFISSFIGYCIFVTFTSISHLMNGWNYFWFGCLLSSLPFILVVAYFFIIGAARSSERLLPMLSVSTAGLLVVLFLNLNSREVLLAPIIYSIIGCFGSWAYVFWYSRFDNRENNALRRGLPLPKFDLYDINRKKISSEDFSGTKNLFIFYRGNWCPLCMAQIKEVAKGYKRLLDNGVRVILVSPQSQAHTERLAKKYTIPFEFYTDVNLEAAQVLNIVSPNGLPFGLQVFGYDSDTVLPTVIITNADNRVLFADITDNYRVRPEPELFESILYNVR